MFFRHPNTGETMSTCTEIQTRVREIVSETSGQHLTLVQPTAKMGDFWVEPRHRVRAAEIIRNQIELENDISFGFEGFPDPESFASVTVADIAAMVEERLRLLGSLPAP